MRELLQEIFASIEKNKLRTALTGFSVAWGILMLIVLLGSGNGLKNGVNSNFEGMSTNSVSIYSGNTSVAYRGHKVGRRIRLKADDVSELKKKHPQITEAAGEVYTQSKITANGNFLDLQTRGATPMAIVEDNLTIMSGRFINTQDIKEERKVVVLSLYASEVLFGKKSPISKLVSIDSVAYTVIGTALKRWGSTNSSGYIPISTVMKVYPKLEDLTNLTFLVNDVNSEEESEVLSDEVRKTLAAKHNFAPNDNQAVYIWSSIKDYLQMQMVFGGISLFVWIIGIGTLMAGVVGVSNIMLVTVRERTTEFGIRKSMGATPASLVRLILTESVIITSAFGYIGMFVGIAIMEVVNFFIEQQYALEEKSEQIPVIFKNPTLDLSVVVSATIVLVIAGVIAGYIPARRAARLKTIDAMRFNS